MKNSAIKISLLTAIALNSALAVASVSSEEVISNTLYRLQHEVSRLENKLDQLEDAEHQKPKLRVTAQAPGAKKPLLQPQVSTPIPPRNATALSNAVTPFNATKTIVGLHRPTVILSPFLGLISAWDGSDLIVNQPSMNEDLLLLQQRTLLEQELERFGMSLNQHPILEMSGRVEAQGIIANNYGTPFSDIDLSGVEMDFNGIVSRNASGFISIVYRNTPQLTGSRAVNTILYVNRAFVTLGNLDKTPFYMSIGQFYVPFGRYSSGMVTTPLTLSLARINTRQALFGFYKDGFFAAGYIYRGDTYIGTSKNLVNEGGVNAGFKKRLRYGINLEAGAGVVSNLADSQGMLNNGNSDPTQFRGFAVTPGAKQLVHRVQALDLNAKLSINKVSFIAEYIDALRSFAFQDLSFNGQGAKPTAVHAEIDLNFKAFDNKPTAVGVAYGHTTQALGLQLPQTSVAVFGSTTWIKNTVESIEFRHDTNYSANDYASGGMVPVTPATAITGTPNRSANIVTLQIGAYF